jgi:hypothetical protein
MNLLFSTIYIIYPNFWCIILIKFFSVQATLATCPYFGQVDNWLLWLICGYSLYIDSYEYDGGHWRHANIQITYYLIMADPHRNLPDRPDDSDLS